MRLVIHEEDVQVEKGVQFKIIIKQNLQEHSINQYRVKTLITVQIFGPIDHNIPVSYKINHCYMCH